MTADSLTAYWQAVRRRLPLLLLIAGTLGLFAYGVSRRVAPVHQVHYSYVVSLHERETAEFTFDGYYALQATDLFTATLAAWMTAPEVVVAAHRLGGLPVSMEADAAIAQRVTALKTAPQLIEVTVRHDDPDRAEQLAVGLQRAVERNVAEYHDAGIPALRWGIITTEPWTVARRPAAALIGFATAVASFFLLVNGVLLYESVRRL